MTDPDEPVEELVRKLAPQLLAALIRRGADFAAAEDATQEALLAATLQWPGEGLPDHPLGWLVRVGSRRLIDRLRSDLARAEREHRTVRLDEVTRPAEGAPGVDDTVTLLVLCCHPALTRPSQVALTLRAVAGLTTAQIARAFLVPEATMAQRISRAKARLRDAGARFVAPTAEEAPARLGAVLDVLYLVFNEGYTASEGTRVHDIALTREAIRLTRLLRESLRGPWPGLRDETTGLLALMLLTEARSPARTTPDGSLVPLADQDRARWDRSMIEEGVDLLTRTLRQGTLGPHQIRAAIAAVHAEASTWEQTDWMQIVVLYRTLDTMSPSPVVTLNLAVAAAMVHGPATGLRMTEPLLEDARMRRHHRLHAVRAHLFEEAGEVEAARTAYERAAQLTSSIPEQRYLNSRRERLG